MPFAARPTIGGFHQLGRIQAAVINEGLTHAQTAQMLSLGLLHAGAVRQSRLFLPLHQAEGYLDVRIGHNGAADRRGRLVSDEDAGAVGADLRDHILQGPHRGILPARPVGAGLAPSST